jgi:prevent-host-death family protein
MHEVTAQEFHRNFSRYQDEALTRPLTITKHGRPRLVMMSVDEYERLKGKGRWVGLTSEMTEEDIRAIEAAEIPEEHAYDEEDLD